MSEAAMDKDDYREYLKTLLKEPVNEFDVGLPDEERVEKEHLRRFIRGDAVPAPFGHSSRRWLRDLRIEEILVKTTQ